MGDLYDISEPDPSIQRNLIEEHRDEMVAFLSEGEYLFFPEVILSTCLSYSETSSGAVATFYENVQSGASTRSISFDDFRLSCASKRTKTGVDSRSIQVFRTATLTLSTKSPRKFSRIDGNHRLSATPLDERFRRHNTPFCLILFRNTSEVARFNRVLFHNTNRTSS